MRQINVRWTRRFAARFRRLSRDDRHAVTEAIEAFHDNPLSPALAIHALHGSMAGKRSIAVDHDLRIIIRIKGDYDEVALLDVGTHDDVYHE